MEPVYDQTKRRKTTNATGKKRNTVKVSYVDSGSGRGRVALEHTIVGGRKGVEWYIQRMERTGTDRPEMQEPGRPPREPG